MGEPWENAVWQFEGRQVTLPNPVKTRKGRSAGRGGSCPTSRVWVGWATRSSYESSNWRAYFAAAPETGMGAVGRNPSASGAKDDSPPFQRWVSVRKRVESPGDGTGFCLGICPALAKTELERGTPDLGFACISAWPGHPAPPAYYPLDMFILLCINCLT